MINIVIGVVPGIIWLIPFILLDKKIVKQNYKNILLLFLFGGIGSYFCYRLEMHFGSYFKKTIISNYFEILFYAIFGVAIFEEGYKWFLLLVNKIVTKLDTLYASLFIGIGFATIENVLYYAIPYGYKIAFFRIFTAYVSHVSNALWMGYFFNKINDNFSKLKKTVYTIFSFIVPIILHALYNSFLYGNNKYGMYFLWFYILLIISSIFLIIIIFFERRGNKWNLKTLLK